MQKQPHKPVGIESGKRSIQHVPLSLFVKTCLAIAMLMLVILLMLFKPFGHDDSDYSMQQQEQPISGGKSSFKIYQNKVYVSVPSGGDYLVEQADIDTIHLLDKDYSARHLAVDHKRVYCGNQALPDLDPSKTYFIGKGYLSDGTVNYYCSSDSISNPDLNALTEVMQIIGYQLNLSKKPQSYIYPFYKLASTKTRYQIIDNDVVSDGRHTYVRGKSVAVSRPQSIRLLPEFTTPDRAMRKSDQYRADGEHVFYADIKLNIQDHERLSSFMWDQGSNNLYLFDPDHQSFYYRDKPFPYQHAPYQLLIYDSSHADNPLFLTDSGIYFFNKKENELQKAGENPFKQHLTRLSPDIFHNGKDLFYLSTGRWKYKHVKRGIRLCSNATVLHRIADTPLREWEKLGMVQYGSLSWTMGSVWKNKGDYYYFDEFGQGQGFNYSIYQINNKSTVDQLLAAHLHSEDARKIILNQTVPWKQGKAFALAEVKTGACWSPIFVRNEGED